MYKLAIVAVLAFATVAAASPDTASFSWSLCKPGENATDHLHDLSVTVSPNPPVLGQKLTISGSGTMDEQVTGGKIDVDVEGLYHTTLNLCDELKKTPYPCPIKAGAYNVGPLSFDLPSFIPKGIPLKATATIDDQNNQQVVCINVDVEF